MCLPKHTPSRGSGKVVLPGLPGAFFTWIKSNPAFMDEMFRWQDANRHLFQGATEEYPLEATIAFNNLMALIDSNLAYFLSAQGLTEAEFSAALEAFQDSDNRILKKFFSLIVKKTDFLFWAGLVRADTCVCCGGGFRALDPTYVAATACVPAPYNAETSPAMASADATLPVGWMAHIDPATGRTFYVKPDGTTTWDPPTSEIPTALPAAPAPLDLAAIQAGLPPGWTAYLDDATGRVFYAGADGTTSWEPPVA